MSSDPRFHNLRPKSHYDRVAVWDIETGGFSGADDPLIAIGAGRYDFENDDRETTIFILNEERDELDLIRRTFDWLNEFDYEATVTYNGEDFDIPFIRDCLNALKFEGSRPELRAVPHIDLITPRKKLAAQTNNKWPSLEECLRANGLLEHTTHWEGDVLTGRRFGEELVPQYIEALDQGDETTIRDLQDVIVDYTLGDIEATAALYRADARGVGSEARN